MHSGETICWLFTSYCTILLGLDLLTPAYPIPCYSWNKLNLRYRLSDRAGLLQKLTQSIPVNCKLDFWSGYDNPEEGHALQGDIKIRPVSRKTTTADPNLLWPNGVVRYFLDDTIGLRHIEGRKETIERRLELICLAVNEPTKMAILDDAMKNIMKMTCVRFIRIYPDVNGKLPRHTWVNITGNDQGCFSDLGRSSVASSILNLDVRRCFQTRGHAIHEILHTLGVFHEHMRPDRDNYIKILWENIKDGDTFNFRIVDKNEVMTYGLPYDYDSVMHYSMTAFSKNKSIPTIMPRKDGVEIGQRNHLSFYDVQKLLITYKCGSVQARYPHEESNPDHNGYVSNWKLVIPNLDASSFPVSIEPSNIGNSTKLVATNTSYNSQYPYIHTTYSKTIPVTRKSLNTF